ncbi:LPS-assembly protein LptD [Sulfurospirillum sp. 1307]|jgi:LPS-assembly protein
MFFRILVLTLSFFSTILLANSSQKVEILAKLLDKNGTIVHAKDEVVLYSDRYIITADEAFYDYNSSDLELIGNITIMDGTKFSTRSGYATLNLKNDNGNLMPMFAYTGDGRMWLKCNEATFDPEFYISKKSIVSSCDVQDPDWKIGFSSGKYVKESKFLHTYNALFYVKDVPLFYLPYFSFSTDKTRRTGLLRPQFSYGKDEGFYFLQPIYFAPQDNWDFQLNPQIRTNRGYGLHGTLRFVDSKYSNGEISFGQFDENNDYYIKNSLKNDKHWGYSITYDRSRLFSELIGNNTEDGLWLDFNYLNDVDYLNTKSNSEGSYDQLIQSTLNYYIKRDLDYIGLYAKYYKDTSKTNNDTTIQELPTLQYHRFTNSILLDNVFYSVDYKTTNLTSKSGFKSVYHQINAPISIYFPLLNDFLHFKATENFYLANVNYTDETVNKKGDGNIIQNYHTISLYTELVKSYDDFYHTFYFGSTYTHPGSSSKSNGFKIIEEDEDLDELQSLSNDTRENLSLDLVEFFYNKSGRKVVSHSLRQSIILGELASDEYKYADLSNDIKIYFTDKLSLTNTLQYSHEYARISKFQTSLNWQLDKYKVSFIHTYQKTRSSNVDSVDNYLTFDVSTNYISNYNFFASTNYDIETDYLKSWSLGWKMKKKCWDYKITYKEERMPKLTSAGSDSTNKKGIYLTFNLYPIGGVSYDFIQESKGSQ